MRFYTVDLVCRVMKPYPFKFRKIFHNKIWGSESWEVSGHKSDPSIIANGDLAGTDLNELIKRNPAEILGNKLAQKYSHFPLLIKILDAKNRLSIQVHPNDRYAKAHEHDLGKTEAWYVMKAAPGARVICGLERGANEELLRKAIEDHTIEPHLNTYVVNAGDVIFIDPGTIHALEENITVYEVQEASDVTYRLYDWGRIGDDGKPRTLHIDDALRVIKWHDHTKHLVRPRLIENKGYTEYELVSCRYFTLERFQIGNSLIRRTSDSFEAITTIGGSGDILFDGGSVGISEGESVLVPAAVNEYELKSKAGHLELLTTRNRG